MSAFNVMWWDTSVLRATCTHTHTQPVWRCVRVALKSTTNTGFVDTSAIWFVEASLCGVFIFHGDFQQNTLVVIFVCFILYSLFVFTMPFVAFTWCKCLENANPFWSVSVWKPLSMTARRRCARNERYEERVRNIWNCLNSRCRRNSSSAKADPKFTMSNSECTKRQRRLRFVFDIHFFFVVFILTKMSMKMQIDWHSCF